MLDEEKMDDHSYFVGPMSTLETYHELKNNGDFLVRLDPQKGNYVLSLYSSSDIHHFEVLQNQNGDFYLETTRLFENPCDLIKSYHDDKGVLPTALSSSQGTLVSPESFAWTQEILRSKFYKIRDLGAGDFGKVYKAASRNRMYVAIKEMDANTMSLDEFKKEAEILTKLRHPNLVTMYGIEETSPTIRIVLEYMKDGSLLDYLRDNRETLETDNSFLVSAVVQTLKGMEYLSRRGYVHRDLAARNCLVNGRVVKVADFGMTKHLKQGKHRLEHQEVFPVRWSPPEVLKDRLYTTQSDVWSFGVLMWEIFTLGETPYTGLDDCQVKQYVLKERILPKPSNCDERFYKWMKSCWSYDPSRRPLFDEPMTISDQKNAITKKLQMQSNITDQLANPNTFWILGSAVVALIGVLGYSLIRNKQNK